MSAGMTPRGLVLAEQWLCQAIEALRNMDAAAPTDVDVRALHEAAMFAELSLDRLRRAVLQPRDDTMPILDGVRDFSGAEVKP